MDNITFLQLIMADGVFSLELLALFATGLYLIVAIVAFPLSISSRQLAGGRVARISGIKRAISLPDYSNSLKLKPSFLQMRFGFGTVAGVGAVMSPPRTWLRQDTSYRK